MCKIYIFIDFSNWIFFYVQTVLFISCGGFFFLQNTQIRLFPDKMSFKTQIVDHNNEIMSSVRNIRP